MVNFADKKRSKRNKTNNCVNSCECFKVSASNEACAFSSIRTNKKGIIKRDNLAIGSRIEFETRNYKKKTTAQHRQIGELECELGERNPKKDWPIKRNWTIQQRKEMLYAQSRINDRINRNLYKKELPATPMTCTKNNMTSNKRKQGLCGISLHCIHFDVEMLLRIFIVIELMQMQINSSSIFPR